MTEKAKTKLLDGFTVTNYRKHQMLQKRSVGREDGCSATGKKVEACLLFLSTYFVLQAETHEYRVQDTYYHYK